ncbi:MAG: FAD-dependent oxidoreductase [Armatimonadetes bacterium]|nr:FAD-dependent oxidoreductase [Armatimonadota bacterium]
MNYETHPVDFCVVGGGLTGMIAAIAAARRGARVALMHDRPVLGGNASSEVRMWVCGAHGANNRETGILEEIMMDNFWRNPTQNYSVWDSILYEKARFEPNIVLLLNCSCNDAEMEGNRIVSVRGWQTTTQTWHTAQASLFADCSGDSVLAPLTGAEFRVGREASGEFGEDIEPPQADRKTMGMSCLIQTRETERMVPYIPPAWANIYATDDDLPHRGHEVAGNNFWWIEAGGEDDSILETEAIRDELLKVVFGVWDHIKNRGDHGAERWAIEWVGFLPGKRESRRYVGDHILTQNDIRAEGRFDDLVAYGGWTMDDHHPGGIRWSGPPTIFHPAPSPYGIPYRSLYSRNIANLWCAGRNLSATHAALSSTRVMGTCSILGQAVGTAAAIAVRGGLTPREVGAKRISELQQLLMKDDCYLPWHTRAVPELSHIARLSASCGDPEPLRNGHDRPVGDAPNSWAGPVGAWIEYAWDAPRPVSEIRLVFDSDLNRTFREGDRNPQQNMHCCHRPADRYHRVPPSLVRSFRIESLGSDGHWTVLSRQTDNHQRLVRLPVIAETDALRLIPEATWGAAEARLFAWDVR